MSHGSSGGPIFNRDGQVVGVAVGMFADGQNLNFAVPSELVRGLESGPPSSPAAFPSLVAKIEALQAQQANEKYSSDPDSEYQKAQTEIETALRNGLSAEANDPESLLKLGEISRSVSSGIAEEIARRVIEIRPSSSAYLLLAVVLKSQYLWSKGEQRTSLMKESETAARSAIKMAKEPTREMYYELGDTLEDEAQYVEAEEVLRKGMSVPYSGQPSDVYFQAVRDMVLCANGLGHPQDEGRWFNELEKSGKATYFDWDAHAKFLYGQREFKKAGDAYSQAAQTIDLDCCEAGMAYDLASEPDLSLAADRKCIEKLSGSTGAESQLAWAHQSIAAILNDRGVYTESLSHAKEATSLDPTNAWAFYTEAESLNNLQRFNEAINASKEAIRLSDGKYPSMHFVLGTSYFKAENWELARQAYEKAAELDASDDASAYNVGVCYVRLSYFRDAAQWYEEALRRNPKRSDRDELRQRIQELRR